MGVLLAWTARRSRTLMRVASAARCQLAFEGIAAQEI